MTQQSNRNGNNGNSGNNGKKNPAGGYRPPINPARPVAKPQPTVTAPKPPVSAPKPASTPSGQPSQRKLTPRQEAIKRKQRQRRQLQLIITGVIAVVAVVAVIILVLALSAPTSFKDISAEATTDPAPFQLGSSDAKVTLIQYGDFRCSVCKQYFDDAEATIRDTFVKTNKVKYVFRNYTVIDDLLKDGVSSKMAQAGICASEQNRFWDFHDATYRNYPGEKVGSPNDKWIKDLAAAVKLDTAKFNSCFDSYKDRQAIATAKQEASTQKSVNGTPTFFIKIGDGAEELVQITQGQTFLTVLTGKLDEAVNKAAANK